MKNGMACTTTPTQTQFTTVTTSSVSTSLSASVTTGPPTLTTIISASCVSSGTLTLTLPSGISTVVGCVSSTGVTQTSTIPGAQSTTQVPVLVTIPVVTTEPTKTLYGTDCSSHGSGGYTGPTTPSTPIDSPTTTPADYTSQTPVVYTTPTTSTFTTQASTTLADGSVMVTYVTQTSVYSVNATSIPVTSSTAALSTLASNSDHAASHNVGPIVGGVVGGLVGLIGLLLLVWYIIKRRRIAWDDIFDKDDHDLPPPQPIRRDRNQLDMMVDHPPPYQYGLVGQVFPLAAGVAVTPSSPPHSPQGSAPVSHPSYSSSGKHSRQASLAPLLVPTTSVSAGGSLATNGNSRPTTGNSRPSTAGSLQAQTIQMQSLSSSTGQRRSVHIDEFGGRPMPIVSTGGDPRVSVVSAPPTMANWDIDDVFDATTLYGTGSSGTIVPPPPRRILQLVNPPHSPTSSVASGPGFSTDVTSRQHTGPFPADVKESLI